MKTMEPKISIIIPVYNTEKYILRCLNSLKNQTLKDIEIICVDDFSSDSTLDILQECAEIDHRIFIIKREENGGAAAARNDGILAASGKYLGFVDSDDWVDLDFFEKLYKRGERERADIVVGNTKYTYDWIGYTN